MSESEIKLVISKEIQAPVEAVFSAWTTPETMKQWFAPGAMTVPIAEVDLKVGGSYLIHMRNSDAKADHIVCGEYGEVIPNERLVLIGSGKTAWTGPK